MNSSTCRAGVCMRIRDVKLIH